MDTEQQLKKQIIKSAESVKKKVKMLRDIKSSNEKVIQSILQPITEPLRQMAACKSPVKHINIKKNTPPRINAMKKRKHNFTPSKTVKKLKFSPATQRNDDEYSYREDSDVHKEDTDFNSQPEIHSDTEDESDNRTSEISFETPSNSSPGTSWSMSSELDNIPFGVRKERGKLLMGNSLVTITENEISIDDKTYLKTDGLMNLLFKKTPELNIITENDKQNYKTILLDTLAHRRDYDASKPIKSNRGQKYTRIIRPLLKVTENYENMVHGTGLPAKKILKDNVDYVYWDNPNELIDRLKLLWASRDAGNTGLNNEIISIIEELRESGIIN